MIKNLKARLAWWGISIKNQYRLHTTRLKKRYWRWLGYTVIEVKQDSERYDRLMSRSPMKVIIATTTTIQAVQSLSPRPEVREWLEQNLAEGFCKIRNDPRGRLYFVFKGPNDAMNFKMRWF